MCKVLLFYIDLGILFLVGLAHWLLFLRFRFFCWFYQKSVQVVFFGPGFHLGVFSALFVQSCASCVIVGRFCKNSLLFYRSKLSLKHLQLHNLFSMSSVITASLVSVHCSLCFILSPSRFADKASGASCINFAASRSPHLTAFVYWKVCSADLWEVL